MTTGKVCLVIRYCMGVTYLWVVMDRIGLLGPSGNVGVVWGNFDNFLEYTAKLVPWFPVRVSNFLGYLVTLAEVTLAVFLILGFRLKETFLASFLLLTTFALSLIFANGIENAPAFIVFTVTLAVTNGYMFWKAR